MRELILPGSGEMLLPQSGVYIKPSCVDPWRFTRGADQLFTWAQLKVLPSYGLDPETCDYLVVRSSASMRELWWPLGQKAPTYLLPCPIIATVDGEPRADGRVLVIAPAGMKKLVWPDGSITRPRVNKRRSDRIAA